MAIAPLPEFRAKAIKSYQPFLALDPAATPLLNSQHPSRVGISLALNAIGFYFDLENTDRWQLQPQPCCHWLDLLQILSNVGQVCF